VKKVASRVYEGLATPRSLTAFLLMKYGEWDQLANLEVDPFNYLTSESYWRDASASAFLKKFEPLPSSYDRKAVAEENFISCERSCLRANIRLYPVLDDLKGHHGNSGLLAFFERARQNIAWILGPCPDLVSGRFGPGATYGDKGVLTTIPDKISSEPQLTHDAWPFLVPWSGTLWAKASSDVMKVPKFVPGNRFLTVPKDATKNRGIAAEPSINVFYQLAYGKVIRERLRRKGISLNEGQDLHRHLACVSSREDDLATLDLKNASDTICRNLVKILLPPRWYEVLDDLRSKKTFFRKRWTVLEKFSSMGNGFTFELETLIFLGLMSAITGRSSIGRSVFAFGDDLIIPSRYSKDVVSMLAFCGLETNLKKTFLSGPFRESCGGDFFLGRSVRPFYLKKDLHQPADIIALMNGLRRSSDNDIGRFARLQSGWLGCLSALPTNIRCLRGPQDLGDIVIHDEPSTWKTKWKHGIRYISCYQPRPVPKIRWGGFADSVTLASIVYGSSWANGYVIPRSPDLDYHIDAVPYS